LTATWIHIVTASYIDNQLRYYLGHAAVGVPAAGGDGGGNVAFSAPIVITSTAMTANAVKFVDIVSVSAWWRRDTLQTEQLLKSSLQLRRLRNLKKDGAKAQSSRTCTTLDAVGVNGGHQLAHRSG
jgi:hypothetical protein